MSDPINKEAFERAKAQADAAFAQQTKTPPPKLPKPAAKVEVKPESAEADEPEDDEEDTGTGTDEDDDEPASTDPDDSALLAELKDLGSKGKVRALLAKLGVDAEKTDVSPAKLRKLQKTLEAVAGEEKKLSNLKRDVATAQAELVNKRAELEREGKDVVDFKKALKGQDWIGVAQVITRNLPEGMTYAQFTQKVAQSHLGRSADPTIMRELGELKADKKAREEREAKEKRERDSASQAEGNRQYVRTSLAKHAIADKKHGLEGFEDQVIAIVHASWDGKEYGKTLKQAADEILSAETAKAKRLLKVKKEREGKEGGREPNGRFTVPHVPIAADTNARIRAARAEADRVYRLQNGGR